MTFGSPAWGAEINIPRHIPISTATVAAQLKEEINQALPHDSPPVLKAADLEESAIGPGWTVLPLPAFVYNRNEGAWAGALIPMFRANKKGEVEDIIAPLYLHNRLIGETFTLNYFGYRHETIQYHAIVSKATKIEHYLDLAYKNIALSDGRYIATTQFLSEKSAFNRFFNFGNNAVASQETNYALGSSTLKLGGGVHVTPSLTLMATERYRDVKIENGAIQTMHQTRDRFPDIPGIDGANIVGQGGSIIYDTRDNQLTPLKGTFATASAEYNENIKFAERNHWWRLTGEARQFIPHANDRAVFVWHALADGIVGQDENSSQEDLIEQDTGQVDDNGNPILQPIISKRLVRRGVPFYERPSLGGEFTLRGFGRGRFVSNFAWVLNLEERLSLFQKSLMGNLIELELAPFVDIGRVGRTFDSVFVLENAQINPGVGLRMLARPNIAGRLDIGWGKDGAAVFVGLDYPF